MNSIDAIAALQDEAWQWGVFDCCQFARRVLNETHGIDFAKGQPEYSTKLGAARILAKAGGMESFVSSVLGDSVPRNLLRRGDVCLAEFPDGMAAGICCGQSAAFASRNGVIFVPLSNVLKGWNVNG